MTVQSLGNVTAPVVIISITIVKEILTGFFHSPVPLKEINCYGA